MHGGDSGLFQSMLKTDIEIGRINPDEQIGTISEEMTRQLPPQGEQFREMPDDLGKAHHGEAFHGNKTGKALFFHERPAHTFYANIVEPLRQRLHEAGTQLIAGRFIGENSDSDQNQCICALCCAR